MKSLIEANADINFSDKYGKTPLHYYVEKINVKIVY